MISSVSPPRWVPAFCCQRVTSAAAAPGAAGEGSGEGKITALFMKQAGYSEDDIRAMTTEFGKAYPKIQVEPTFVAYEALHDKIVAAAPAGTYDVVLIDVIWPAEFGTKRIVADVTSQFPAAWKTEMLGGALATAAYRDHYYGVPWILDTKYFFYNTDMMSRAGVDPASLSTWDGVMAAAGTLKAKKIVDFPLVWSWKQAEALICDYTQLLGAFGGKFLSDDGASAPLTPAAALQALEFMKRSLDDKLTNPNSIESLEEDVRKIFSEGTAAMALNWTYMFAAANDPAQSKIAGKVAVTPTPSGSAGAPGCQRLDGAVRHLGQQEPEGSLDVRQLHDERSRAEQVCEELPAVLGGVLRRQRRRRDVSADGARREEGARQPDRPTAGSPLQRDQPDPAGRGAERPARQESTTEGT